MIRNLLVTFTFLFCGSVLAQNQDASIFQMPEDKSDLEVFVKDYLELMPKTEQLSEAPTYDEIINFMSSAEEAYSFFYEGPEESILEEAGEEQTAKEVTNPKYLEWRDLYIKRRKMADDYVAQLLQKPTAELNIFILGLMDRYLNQAKERAALKEIITSFTSLRFNSAIQNKIDQDDDWRHQAPTGAIVAGVSASALCALRWSKCNELARRIRIFKEAEESLKRTKERRFRLWPKREKKLKGNELVMQARIEAGLTDHDFIPTAGATLAKESHLRQFGRRFSQASKTIFAETSANLKLVAGIAALGGTGNVAYQQTFNNPEDVLHLDPADLEKKYFGGLAIFELTCRARELLLDENASLDQIQNFIVGLHSETQILGRMLGKETVLDKMPLEFITPLPETNEYEVNIQFEDDENGLNFYDVRNCPNVADFGPLPHTSFAELKYQIVLLTKKAEALMPQAPENEVPQ